MTSPIPKYLLLLLLIICVILLYSRYIVGDYFFIFVDIGGDTINSFYPKLLEKTHLESSSWIDTWSFMRGIGKNIYDVGILDPTSWPIFILNKENITHYIVWRQVLRIILIGIFIYKFFELKGFDQNTVIISTMLFLFSGYLITSSGWYAHTYFILNFAIAIYTFELLLRKGIWWPFSISILLFFGLNLYFFAEFLCLYFVISLTENWERLKEKKERKTLYKNGLKSTLLALLLIAPFVGQLIQKILNSPRFEGMQDELTETASKGIFSLASQLEYLSAFLKAFSPDILGNALTFRGWENYLESPNLYIGLLSLVLLPFGFYAMSSRVRWSHFFVLSIWSVILIFPFFRFGFYGFGGNFYKLGINLFFPFTLLHIAAYGIDYVCKHIKISNLVFSTPMLFSASLLVLFQNYEELFSKHLLYVTIGLLWVYTFVFFFLKNLNLRILLIMLLVLSEGFYFSKQTLDNRKAISKSSFKDKTYFNDYTVEALNYLKNKDSGFYRIEKSYDSAQFSYNDAAGHGYYSSGSYDSHNHKNYLSFLNNYDAHSNIHGLKDIKYIDGIIWSPLLHPFFSVKYLFSTGDFAKSVWPQNRKYLRNIFEVNVHENKYFIPFGIPISKFFTDKDFKQIDNPQKLHMSLYEGVVIEDTDLYKVDGMRQTDSKNISTPSDLVNISKDLAFKALRIEKFYNDKIEGSINIDDKSVLVFTMPYDEGWKVYLNNKETKKIFVNKGLLGVVVEKGSYKVLLQYTPPFFYPGWFLFFVGFSIVSILFIKPIIDKRRIS